MVKYMNDGLQFGVRIKKKPMKEFLCNWVISEYMNTSMVVWSLNSRACHQLHLGLFHHRQSYLLLMVKSLSFTSIVPASIKA